MFFSVIVPIYKVEKYLVRCIESVLKQSFEDFELILVDDGSPDRCPEICDEYMACDNRIRVIHKENGGLVSARQAGIKTARPYRAHEHRHRIGALFHIDAHRLPLAGCRRQTGPYTPGQTVVVFVGIGFAVIQHRRPLGITFGTGAEVFQHVIHICSSFGVFYGAITRISL